MGPERKPHRSQSLILISKSNSQKRTDTVGEIKPPAATANLNPWTEAKVDTENPERGPLLIISGEQDNTVPPVVANASFELERRNTGVTEIVQIPDRGHALTTDSGWREVAGKALAFVQRHVSAG